MRRSRAVGLESEDDGRWMTMEAEGGATGALEVRLDAQTAPSRPGMGLQ